MDLFASFHRDQLGFLEQHHREYRDFYRWSAARQKIWVLTRPDLVQRVLTGRPDEFEKGKALQRSRDLLGDGLLTAEGENHLLYRRMMQPAFRKARIAAYGEVMTEESSALAKRWSESASHEIDLHEAMMDLALRIVARTLLGQPLDSEVRLRIAEALETSIEGFRYTLMPFFSLLRKLPLPLVRRYDKARQELREIVNAMVAQVDRKNEDSILALLEGASPEQMADQALTILLAGHETTANAVTFAFYLLARNKPQRERFRRELTDVLGGRAAQVSDYSALTYTKHVVEETLRLFPPAWVVGRLSKVPVPVDDFIAEKGSLLLIPQWLMHRDPRYFDQPCEFRPERWDTASLEKGTFFPFGAGTRVCIGEGFARLEAVIILATLGQQFDFELIENSHIGLSAGITLRPKGGLRVRLREMTAAER